MDKWITNIVEWIISMVATIRVTPQVWILLHLLVASFTTSLIWIHSAPVPQAVTTNMLFHCICSIGRWTTYDR